MPGFADATRGLFSGIRGVTLIVPDYPETTAVFGLIEDAVT
jgi:hypothetical protein